MKKILKIILNFLKKLLLLPFYCMLPNKYNGETYEEWLGDKEKDDM